MGVGVEGHSLRLLSVLSGPIGNSVTDESVHGLLSKLESGLMNEVDWVLAKTFRYCVDVKSVSESLDPGYRYIMTFSGLILEFRGKYYQMPNFDEL